MPDLASIATDVQTVVTNMQNNMLFSVKIVGILWIIHLINWITKYHLNLLGIHTRSPKGLPGIVCCPFLHANFNHIFFNTIPLFFLTDLVMLDGPIIFYTTTVTIILLSGILIWLMGKRGVHVGASAVIMGYFGYLLAKAYFNVTGVTIILAGISLYYFGGLLLSVFPDAKKNVSWEGHLFGLASGVFVAFYLPTILQIENTLLLNNPF
jgi:membrane associated rhomboid family serine protease